MPLFRIGDGRISLLNLTGVPSIRFRAAFCPDAATFEMILGGVPREQKMLMGHLPRVIYYQVLVLVYEEN